MTKSQTHQLIWPTLLLYTTVLHARATGTNSLVDAKGWHPPVAVESETTSLAKATQNPCSQPNSVPIQKNFNCGVGSYNRTQDVINIQPVIPIRASENETLITRVIQPLVRQPYSTANAGGQLGFGDINPTFFFSPAAPGKLIWGLGPAILIPFATTAVLGQGKLSFGPSVVALIQPGHWKVGVLVKNVFSVTDSFHRPSINQMTPQEGLERKYRANHHCELTQPGWRQGIQRQRHQRWHVWTVPFDGGVGRVMRLGYQPVNISTQFYGSAVHPAGASPWGMRLQIALLYPKTERLVI